MDGRSGQVWCGHWPGVFCRKYVPSFFASHKQYFRNQQLALVLDGGNFQYFHISHTPQTKGKTRHFLVTSDLVTHILLGTRSREVKETPFTSRRSFSLVLLYYVRCRRRRVDARATRGKPRCGLVRSRTNNVVVGRRENFSQKHQSANENHMSVVLLHIPLVGRARGMERKVGRNIREQGDVSSTCGRAVRSVRSKELPRRKLCLRSDAGGGGGGSTGEATQR